MKKIKMQAFDLLVQRYIEAKLLSPTSTERARILLFSEQGAREELSAGSGETIICCKIGTLRNYKSLLSMKEQLISTCTSCQATTLYLFYNFFVSFHAMDQLRTQLEEEASIHLFVVDRTILVSYHQPVDTAYNALNGYEKQCVRFADRHSSLLADYSSGAFLDWWKDSGFFSKSYASVFSFYTLLLQEYLIQYVNVSSSGRDSQQLEALLLELQYFSGRVMIWKQNLKYCEIFRNYCREVLQDIGTSRSSSAYYRLQGLCSLILISLWEDYDSSIDFSDPDAQMTSSDSISQMTSTDSISQMTSTDSISQMTSTDSVSQLNSTDPKLKFPDIHFMLSRIVDRIGKCNGAYSYIFESMASYIPLSYIWNIIYDGAFLSLPATKSVLQQLILTNRTYTDSEEKQLLLLVRDLYPVGAELTSVLEEKIRKSQYGMTSLGMRSDQPNIRYFIPANRNPYDYDLSDASLSDTSNHAWTSCDESNREKNGFDNLYESAELASLTINYNSPLTWVYAYQSATENWKLTIQCRIDSSKMTDNNPTNHYLLSLIGSGSLADICIENKSAHGKVSILYQLKKCLDIHSYGSAEIVGLWYESQFDGRIPERTLVFDPGLRLRREDNAIVIDIQPASDEPIPFFYRNAKSEDRRINKIVALVGKNGSGKTTAFRMISQDSTQFSVRGFGAYVIVYRIQNHYYYSKYDPCERYTIQGIREEFDISVDPNKNATTIFFSSALSINTKNQTESINGVDLSNSYIWNQEMQQEQVSQFYDVGRKLQLLKDRSLEQFQAIFHFLPGFISFCIPKVCEREVTSRKARRFLNQLVSSQMLREENRTAGIYYAFSIPLDSKQNIRMADQLYMDVMEWLSSPAQLQNEHYRQLIRDTVIEIPGLSSGQYAIFDFYARLHSFFASQIPGVGNFYNNFSVTNGLRNYILLLDEIELYLHPEWQKGFLAQLIEFLEWEQTFRENLDLRPYENMQILISSNSPFFMSDLPRANVCMLCAEGQTEPEHRETFAQNIHTLMKTSFFMGEGLNGVFSSEKIREAFARLQDEETPISPAEQQELKYLISIIGEPLLRDSLQDLYDSRFPTEQDPEFSRVLAYLSNNCSTEQIRKILAELEIE